MATSEAYLLDTSIASPAWYEGDRRHKVVRERLEEIGDDAVFVSAVSIAEIEYGLHLHPLDAVSQNSVRNAMQ